jgi:adenylate kinase family enzyme
MHIANNIIKYSLQNVYFLTGTALAGKTTMSKAIAKKHGFVWFDENYNGKPFKTWESICEESYQPLKIERDKRHNKQEKYDWDAHFNRPIEEFFSEQSQRGSNDEFMEFAIIELIKLSQHNKVITDICAPLEFLIEISDYNRIACLLAAPHLVTTENYGSRDDHKSYLQWIKSLNDSEKKIAKQDEIFRIQTEKTIADVKKHNLFTIVRTETSTVEATLKLLEEHFKL